VIVEVTETSGVRDFETPEDLECSIVEKSKGPKARATWQVYGTSGLWEISYVDSKEAFSAEVSNPSTVSMLDEY
jgi:hypothetical protein